MALGYNFLHSILLFPSSFARLCSRFVNSLSYHLFLLFETIRANCGLLEEYLFLIISGVKQIKS